MAGHSKWANIKHRKGAQDAKRGKVFTKIIKEITVSVKVGGSDIDSNPRLRSAIQNAKGVNMPKDNILRAIKKASGNDAESYTEVNYEGYGPGGIAIFIECATDNINRTVAEIRSIFNKSGGELGKNGSLEYLFDRKGLFVIEKEKIKIDLEQLEMDLIDSGLIEFEITDKYCTIISEFEKFGEMQSKLYEISVETNASSIERIPKDTMKLNSNDSLKILDIIEKFEDLDDVQKVFHNLFIDDNLLQQLSDE
tara:strand:- start:710 stop:1465 length:756 start_codon:yes stop_codon:yes gene_type:complete